MDFEFSEEEKMFRDSIREFLEKEFAPITDERDNKGPFKKRSSRHNEECAR